MDRTKKFKLGDKVRCVSPRSRYSGCDGVIIKIVSEREGYEQEVAVSWYAYAGATCVGQSNRMQVSGLELTEEPTKIKPKFKVGDVVTVLGICDTRVIVRVEEYGKTYRSYKYETRPRGNMMGMSYWSAEENMTPYSEPKSESIHKQILVGGKSVGDLTVFAVNRNAGGASMYYAAHALRERDAAVTAESPKDVPISKNSTTKKENTMQLKLTTRHFLNGKDVADLHLSQIYEAISQAESQIRELEKIENKPKRLVKEIDQRRADLKALVEFLDKQDEQA